jgi:hypothetical protein
MSVVDTILTHIRSPTSAISQHLLTHKTHHKNQPGSSYRTWETHREKLSIHTLYKTKTAYSPTASQTPHADQSPPYTMSHLYGIKKFRTPGCRIELPQWRKLLNTACQCVARLFYKHWTSSWDRCSKPSLLIEKYEEMLTGRNPLLNNLCQR